VTGIYHFVSGISFIVNGSAAKKSKLLFEESLNYVTITWKVRPFRRVGHRA